jgi:hypothetical protein
MATVTRQQAARVLGYVQGLYDVYGPDGPKLVEDWDGRDFVIIWEDGYDDWPMNVSNNWVMTADGVWVEPVNNGVLAIYREEV